MKTKALKDALDTQKYDFVFGGARRDEEEAGQKKILSHRSNFHTWTPENQRLEPWNLFNYEKKIMKVLEFFHYQIGQK